MTTAIALNPRLHPSCYTVCEGCKSLVSNNIMFHHPEFCPHDVPNCENHCGSLTCVDRPCNAKHYGKTQAIPPPPEHKALTVVSGGVAYLYSDDTVQHKLVDMDNIGRGDECVLPEAFRKLAKEAGVEDSVQFEG